VLWKEWSANEFGLSYETIARRMRDARDPIAADDRREQDRERKDQEKVSENAKADTAPVISSQIDPTARTSDPAPVAPTPLAKSMFDELVTAWELADTAEHVRFLEYLASKGYRLKAAATAAPPLAPIEPATVVEAQPTKAAPSPAAAPPLATSAEPNRLFTIWSNLKPNTQKCLVAWVKADFPNDFPMIDNIATMKDSAAPFRELATRCNDTEVAGFLKLACQADVGAALATTFDGLPLATPTPKSAFAAREKTEAL
jgi:hypothetical protein